MAVTSPGSFLAFSCRRAVASHSRAVRSADPENSSWRRLEPSGGDAAKATAVTLRRERVRCCSTRSRAHLKVWAADMSGRRQQCIDSPRLIEIDCLQERIKARHRLCALGSAQGLVTCGRHITGEAHNAAGAVPMPVIC